MMLLKHEKTGYIHTRVLSIFAKLRLTLGVLRSSSCALQTILLSFLLTGITCQETGLLQNRSVVSTCFEQRTCDAMTHCTGLAGITAAVYVDLNVKLILCLSQDKR